MSTFVTTLGGSVPPEGEMIYPSHKLNFRSLRPDEVEVRPADTRNGKAKLLLYKNARVDRNILDATVGPLNWQSEYYEQRNLLFCRVGIKNPESGEWIWKADTGSESNIEAEKGLASDAFKRACFAFGIGKELYTTPVIKVDIQERDMYNGNFTQTFSVKKMDVENGVITNLVIVDKWGNERFAYTASSTVPVEEDLPGFETTTTQRVEVKTETLTGTEKERLFKDFCSRKKGETGVNLRELEKFYQFYLGPSRDNPNKSKVETFTNPIPERLWERWLGNAR